jgi:hypothetical protein
MSLAVYNAGKVRRVRRIATCVAVVAAVLLVSSWALLVALRAGYFDVEIGPAPVVALSLLCASVAAGFPAVAMFGWVRGYRAAWTGSDVPLIYSVAIGRLYLTLPPAVSRGDIRAGQFVTLHSGAEDVVDFGEFVVVDVRRRAAGVRLTLDHQFIDRERKIR